MSCPRQDVPLGAPEFTANGVSRARTGNAHRSPNVRRHTSLTDLTFFPTPVPTAPASLPDSTGLRYRNKCGTNRLRLSVIGPSDSRMPIPQDSPSTTHEPMTTWLPSNTGTGASAWKTEPASP
jgi:hypothetical protein